MSKEIKLKIAILDDSGKLVEIPQFIQKHINQIEKRWFEKMKKLDENYKKQIHELEHRLSNCIEPKFKIGDKVWAVCWQTFIGEKYNYEIVNGKIDHLFIDRDNQVLYGTMSQSFREQNLFATEEEAKAKLEELKK